MSNFLGNLSLALKFKLGLVPSTEAYEARLRQMWEDVKFLRSFPQESLYKEYEELLKSNFPTKEEQKKASSRRKQITKDASWKRFEKLKKSASLAEFMKQEVVFEDHFEEKQLDESKWLTKFFWGEKLLGQGYSHTDEFHNYTDGTNVAIANGKLQIHTKKENSTSLSWDKKYGFVPRKSGYTSGIVNTGKSFRQKYGRFEAKVSVSPHNGIYSAFWMVGDSATPHLNIFKITDSLELGLLTDGNANNQSKLAASSLKERYYIAGVEWNSKEIRWLINGTTVKRVSKNLPEVPLYLVLSSGIYKDVEGAKVDHHFEVEWVKCYQKAQQ